MLGKNKKFNNSIRIVVFQIRMALILLINLLVFVLIYQLIQLIDLILPMKLKLLKMQHLEKRTKRENGMVLQVNQFIVYVIYILEIYFMMYYFQRADLGLAGLTITYQREQVFRCFFYFCLRKFFSFERQLILLNHF